MSTIVQGRIVNMELKKRSDIHYTRKIWHMAGVFTVFLMYTHFTESTAKLLLFLLFLVAVPADVLRQNRPELNDFLIHLFRPIMRSNELRKLAGTSYLITGVNLIIWFFPRPIVSMTLLFLAFADPIASFIGIRYGKDKIFGHKSIQGFIAAFVVCLIVSISYMWMNSILVDHIFIVGTLAGLIGALAELIPIGKIDDNLSLPLLSCLGLTMLFFLFGFFTHAG